ncbi:MAG: PAS domain-containing protein, partial [Bacteroidales bacterium]|nr:PAS domain-containing protein [Bacteroidales bacterium]
MKVGNNIRNKLNETKVQRIVVLILVLVLVQLVSVFVSLEIISRGVFLSIIFVVTVLYLGYNLFHHFDIHRYLGAAKNESDEVKVANEYITAHISELILYTNVVIILVIDKQGTIEYISGSLCDILEGDEKDLLGANWYIQFVESPEITIPCVEKLFEINEQLKKPVEYKIKTLKGRKRLLSWNCVCIEDEISGKELLFCTGKDITTQRKIISELKRSEEKYRLLVDKAQAGIFQTNES